MEMKMLRVPDGYVVRAMIDDGEGFVRIADGETEGEARKALCDRMHQHCPDTGIASMMEHGVTLTVIPREHAHLNAKTRCHVEVALAQFTSRDGYME